MINPSATIEALASLRISVPFDLPAEYYELLGWSDGGEGPLGEIYLTVWSSGLVLNLNNSYEFLDFLPNVWVIGSDDSYFYAYERTSGQGTMAMRFPVGFMHPSGIGARCPNLKTMFAQLESGALF